MNSSHRHNVKRHAHQGFSLVEMLIYVSILSLMLVVIINTIGTLTSSLRRIKSTKAIESSSIAVLERVIRETRDATSVNGAQSVLGSNPGTLSLNSKDINGNARTVLFSVIGGRLHVTENGVDQGPLTQGEITIQNIVFQSTTTQNSTGIKVDLKMSAGTSTAYRSEQFYSSAVLRGAY